MVSSGLAAIPGEEMRDVEKDTRDCVKHENSYQEGLMRYRLIPSRDPRALMWHEDDLDDARASAERSYLASGTKPEERIPVLLCEAPTGGIVRHVETIGGASARVRRR